MAQTTLIQASPPRAPLTAGVRPDPRQPEGQNAESRPLRSGAAGMNGGV